MPTNPKPYAIGLVGGIASGKSFVAQQLAQLGAEIIDADRIGHEVLRQPLVVRRVVQRFGQEVLDDEGQLDRERLAALVFGDSHGTQQRRQELEAIVHPIIHAEAVRALRAYREAESPPRAVVIDAPLLLEADWAPMCDLILFVDTPENVRLTRAQARGWTAEQFREREASQMSLAEKRTAATHLVSGSDRDELLRQLQAIWRQLD